MSGYSSATLSKLIQYDQTSVNTMLKRNGVPSTKNEKGQYRYKLSDLVEFFTHHPYWMEQLVSSVVPYEYVTAKHLLIRACESVKRYERHYSVRDLTDIFDHTRSAAGKWLSRGLLEYTMDGTIRMVSMSNLCRFLKEHPYRLLRLQTLPKTDEREDILAAYAASIGDLSGGYYE